MTFDAKAVADKYIARDGQEPAPWRGSAASLTTKELRWIRKAILRRGWMPYRLRDGEDAPLPSELRSLDERGLIQGPPWRITKHARDSVKAHDNPTAPLHIVNLIRTLAEVEKDSILAALEHCGGNRTHTAKALGITVRTIRNKLRSYKRANGNR